jgi:type I restriction enzyme S subunit
LQSNEFRNQITKLVTGSAQLNFGPSHLKQLKVNLPPLAQQQRIAAILDKAAEIKAKREQAIAKLDELAASAFDECCLKSTNQITTKIKNLVVKRKLTETNDMNVWSLALDQIESNSGQVHSQVMVSKAKLGTSTYYFEPDVVLYSKLRPYLNKVVIPETYGYATTELVPLYCDTGKILPIFMAAYLRSSKFVNFANTNSAGAKMPRVMMDKFWDYEMTLPNLSVQRDFEQLSEKCVAMKKSLKDCIDKQEQLITSLQHQAFTTGFNA